MIETGLITNLIADLAEQGLIQAVEKHGKAYNTPEEFYAVLKEEQEELFEAQKRIEQEAGNLWRTIRGKERYNEFDINRARESAVECIKEAADVIATLDKWTLGGKDIL
jgi:Zn-dependent M32 family carboxypeptidase